MGPLQCVCIPLCWLGISDLQKQSTECQKKEIMFNLAKRMTTSEEVVHVRTSEHHVLQHLIHKARNSKSNLTVVRLELGQSVTPN